MSTDLRFGCTVIYVDGLAAAMDFYRRALGLEPRFYDADAGYAELGPEGHLALAAHRAGEMMMPGAYNQHGKQVSAVEVAFFTSEVAAAFDRAVAAGAVAMTPPRDMPWGQTVAYVQSPEGTILGFATPMGGSQG